MKRRGLLNKHLSKQPELLSDQNKQKNNNIIYVKAYFYSMYAKVQLHLILIWLLRRGFLNIFFENLPFMSPWQPIKLRDFNKSHMKHGGLLKNSCKNACKKSNIPNETAEISNFHFFHYKSKENSFLVVNLHLFVA